MYGHVIRMLEYSDHNHEPQYVHVVLICVHNGIEQTRLDGLVKGNYASCKTKIVEKRGLLTLILVLYVSRASSKTIFFHSLQDALFIGASLETQVNTRWQQVSLISPSHNSYTRSTTT